MRLTLELTPDEQRRVEAAQSIGTDVQALLKGTISRLPAPPDLQDAADLFAQWAAEDATDDPAEIEQAERELAEFKRQIDENRRLSGEEPVYGQP